MEQRLDATYLRPGLVERTTAIGIGAVCIGTGVLLAAWGISFLWRYTPPEIAVRVANPELHVTQDSPLKVTQDKPFSSGWNTWLVFSVAPTEKQPNVVK